MREQVPSAEVSLSQAEIVEARPEDASGFVDVQYKTWLSTYPKVAPDYITEEMVHEKFTKTRSLEERIQVAAERIAHPDEGAKVYVAKEEDTIVGFVVATKAGAEMAEVNALYVRPDKQGAGIGRRLFIRALEWVDAAHEPVKLEVMALNRPAIDFYERFEFSGDPEKLLPKPENPPDGIYMPHFEMIREPAIVK